jgi:hypothetical protein
MKKFILFLVCLLPLFLNCRKSDPEQMTLNITSTDWYTTTSTYNNNTFCEVHVKVSGNSNAELISIETYGDGLARCGELKCDSDKKFNADVFICFFPLRDSLKGKFGTVITAYSSRIKPKIAFCDAVGSGEILRKSIESPMLTCK